MPAARPALVGAFVLGGLALVVAAILFFGGGRLLQRTSRAVAFFEGSVAGLDVGAPVTFRGVRVGAVKRVTLQLAADGRALIPVYLDLMPEQVLLQSDRVQPPEIGQLVAAGLRAQLNLQSFVTGQLRVDLDLRPDTPDNRVAAAETGGLAQIPTIPSDLEHLRATIADLPLRELAASAQRTLTSIERLANHVDASWGQLTDGAQDTLGNTSQAIKVVQQAVGILQNEAATTLQEVHELARDARRQLGGRGPELARLLNTLERAGRRTEDLLGTLSTLTAPRSAFRDDLDASLRDIAASASSLRGFARDLERDPSVLLRGRGK